MTDCIFCKIIAGEIPAEMLFEDDKIIAFKDINPAAPVHILLIPRLHIETLVELQGDDAGLIGHLILTANNLAKQANLAERGYRLVFNCKHEGGQEVYHLHLHLIGGRQMTWPPG